MIVSGLSEIGRTNGRYSISSVTVTLLWLSVRNMSLKLSGFLRVCLMYLVRRRTRIRPSTGGILRCG